MGSEAKRARVAQAAFEQRHTLLPRAKTFSGEFGPPYPAERSDYDFYTSSRPAGKLPSAYVFHWDDQLRMYGSFRWGLLRDDVLKFALGFRQAEIEGPRELLEMAVPGDWVIRKGASKADLLKALEAIFRDEFKQSVVFTQREVERDVVVVKGSYKFHPLGDVVGEARVHLGTDSLPASEGGGGSGTLQEMFDWLGNRMNILVVNESESAGSMPGIVWRDHLAEESARVPSNDEEGRATLKGVLANLTKQTELTFERQRRVVKVWFVSRTR